MRTFKRTNKKILTPRQKEIQLLQKSWESTKQRLKKSKKKEDKLVYNFLVNNEVDPKTGLIDSKSSWKTHYVSCKAQDFKN